jgi:hypothetical protein
MMLMTNAHTQVRTQLTPDTAFETNPKSPHHIVVLESIDTTAYVIKDVSILKEGEVLAAEAKGKGQIEQYQEDTLGLKLDFTFVEVDKEGTKTTASYTESIMVPKPTAVPYVWEMFYSTLNDLLANCSTITKESIVQAVNDSLCANNDPKQMYSTKVILSNLKALFKGRNELDTFRLKIAYNTYNDKTYTKLGVRPFIESTKVNAAYTAIKAGPKEIFIMPETVAPPTPTNNALGGTPILGGFTMNL